MGQDGLGICWLYAATNNVRLQLMTSLNISSLEISIGYLLFFHKVYTVNIFFENISNSFSSPDESPVVAKIFKEPAADGGNLDMALALLRSQSIVPMNIYSCKQFSAEEYSNFNQELNQQLISCGLILRQLVNENKDQGEISDMFKIFKLYFDKRISDFLGKPAISANDYFN